MLLATRGLATELQLDQILSHCYRVFLVNQELLDGSSLGRVDGNVDLVGFDGRDLFVLLNVVADLCWGSVLGIVGVCMVHARFDHCFRVPSVIDSAICGTLTTVSAAGGVSIGARIIRRCTNHSFVSVGRPIAVVWRAVQDAWKIFSMALSCSMAVPTSTPGP